MKRAHPLLPLLLVLLAGCDGPDPHAAPVEFLIPPGAGFSQVLDTLQSRELVRRPGLFTLYARLRGADRSIRAGRYVLEPGASWAGILDALTRGAIVPRSLTIPEGWTLRQMVPRIAEAADLPEAAVEPLLLDGDSLAAELGVPGPGLEGYLFPDTYLFAEGMAPERIVRAMVDAYKGFWSEQNLARLDSLGMTEREVVTLASIVQAEAGNEEEMDLIAGVYHNRLDRGWPLQADPTVLYALGGGRTRLLYAAMDSVADHPYNTYTHPGLPPGPIGSPGRAALEAALRPAETDYMYFVAGPDGGHVFSETLAEHNRAVAEYRRHQSRERERRREEAADPQGS